MTAEPRNARILLVEDNPGDVRLVRLMIEGFGGGSLQLEAVGSLDAAWPRLLDDAPCCVLLDLSLPDVNRLEGVEQLRAAVPELPIIVLTGRDDLALGLAAVQAGAQDYLVKGKLDGETLIRSIRYAIERKLIETQLAHQALHDPLTGLPNRALFADRLQQALVRRQLPDSSVAVLYLDLDRFKVVNDSLGHAAGDRVLVTLAQRLRASLRPSDTVARFGGDEFTILCEEVKLPNEPSKIAERIARAIACPIELDGTEMVLTVSIGIALPGTAHRSADVLIQNADAAMYRAKERGRACWVMFDEDMQRRAVERLELETALRRAVDHGDLALVYQPLLSINDGAVVGYEALCRWDHPTRGPVAPVDFIPLAEETGLIGPLGGWVLEEACRQQRRWLEIAGSKPPTLLCVNLSGRQLAMPDLPHAVAAILDATGVDPTSICLEITESALVGDVHSAIAALLALRSLGLRLSIDDFGAGYTSLGHFKHFPIDIIKLDRCLVTGLGRDRSDTAIAMAVIRLAHSLQLTTVAEGVETEEQLASLHTLGCDVAQGFLFSTPQPAAVVDRWLRGDLTGLTMPPGNLRSIAVGGQR